MVDLKIIFVRYFFEKMDEYFLPNFPDSRFWTKILIFNENPDICRSFRFLTIIQIFDGKSNFCNKSDFWRKLVFLTNLQICDENSYFSPIFRFLMKIRIFWRKFRFVTKIKNKTSKMLYTCSDLLFCWEISIPLI